MRAHVQTWATTVYQEHVHPEMWAPPQSFVGSIGQFIGGLFGAPQHSAPTAAEMLRAVNWQRKASIAADLLSEIDSDSNEAVQHVLAPLRASAQTALPPAPAPVNR